MEFNSLIKNNIYSNLDTLEITSDFFLSKSHEKLYYGALSKARTIQSNLKLIDVAPKVWQKQYWKTFHCASVLLQDGNKSKGELCRKRWCANCNRIKTAEMVNSYLEPLQELQKDDDLYLITLTSKTVKEKRLKFEIERRIKAFTRIKDNLRKNHNIKLIGCRKLEITYNESEDKYHPHFHFIQQGKKEALHNIYVAIDGKRVFQTYGKLRKVKEVKETKEEINQIDFIKPNYEIWKYDNTIKDYVNAYNQELIGTQQIIYDIEDRKQRKNREKIKIFSNGK